MTQERTDQLDKRVDLLPVNWIQQEFQAIHLRCRSGELLHPFNPRRHSAPQAHTSVLLAFSIFLAIPTCGLRMRTFCLTWYMICTTSCTRGPYYSYFLSSWTMFSLPSCPRGTSISPSFASKNYPGRPPSYRRIPQNDENTSRISTCSAPSIYRVLLRSGTKTPPPSSFMF